MRATPPTALIMLILLKLHRCFGHDLKVSMWYGLSDFFVTSVLHNLNLVFFQTLLLSTYVPCEGNSSYEFYLFQIIPYFSKKFLVGDVNSLNLLVVVLFFLLFRRNVFPAKWFFGKVLCSQT